MGLFIYLCIFVFKLLVNIILQWRVNVPNEIVNVPKGKVKELILPQNNARFNNVNDKLANNVCKIRKYNRFSVM